MTINILLNKASRLMAGQGFDPQDEAHRDLLESIVQVLSHLQHTSNRLHGHIREKWVAKLRSGEYPQTQKWLRSNDGYCCLGVLCEVANPWPDMEPWVRPNEGREPTSFSDEYIYEFADGSQTLPPYSVIDDIVQEDIGDTYYTDNEFVIALHGLARVNDMGASFGLIADLIEHHF